MTSIKAFREGDNRLILVIDGIADPANNDIRGRINALLLDIIGTSMPDCPAIPGVATETHTETPPDTQKATPIDAIPTLFSDPPIMDPRTAVVDGIDVGKAIDQGEIASIVRIIAKSGALDENIRQEVVTLCKNALTTDLQKRNVEGAIAPEIKAFFEAYKPLLKDVIHHILQTAGFENLDRFCSFADEVILRDAYEAAIQNLLFRMGVSN